jgi:hypothetical protein
MELSVLNIASEIIKERIRSTAADFRVAVIVSGFRRW